MAVDIEKLKNMTPPKGMEFHISKVGHVVLRVSDLELSTEFYTKVLGFKVSDVYPEDMMPGGMVFLRCNTDHHCLALVGAGDGKNANRELHHLAFEVPTLAEVVRARDRLRAANAKIDFDGRRRAGCQIAGNLLGRRSSRKRRPRPAVERMARR
jgi:catechol 2,3-dioxygenase